MMSASSTLQIRAAVALRQSPIPALRKLSVEESDTVVIVLGSVSSYYLKQLAQHGHIVGSHTMTHPNLAFVAPEEVRGELRESKQRMETQLNAPVPHFSYPCPALFPNWTEQTVEESRRVGYQTAVTTSTGLTRRNDNPLGLKRVRPTKTVEGLEWTLASAFAGRAL